MEIFLSIAVPLPCPFPHKVSFSFLLFWFILLFLFANINNLYTYLYPFLPHCYTEDRILDIPFYTLCFLLNNISGDHSIAVTFHVSFYSWRVFHCVNGPQLIQPVLVMGIWIGSNLLLSQIMPQWINLRVNHCSIFFPSIFLGQNTGSGISGTKGNCISNRVFLKSIFKFPTQRVVLFHILPNNHFSVIHSINTYWNTEQDKLVLAPRSFQPSR